ncbi:hypothetical protein D3C72_2319740 [compost metagenome]
MDERSLGEDARIEAQQAGPAAAAAAFVERAGQDLLLDAGGVAFRHFPAGGQVQGMELVVKLVDCHADLRYRGKGVGREGAGQAACGRRASSSCRE